MGNVLSKELKNPCCDVNPEIEDLIEKISRQFDEYVKEKMREFDEHMKEKMVLLNVWYYVKIGVQRILKHQWKVLKIIIMVNVWNCVKIGLDNINICNYEKQGK